MQQYSQYVDFWVKCLKARLRMAEQEFDGHIAHQLLSEGVLLFYCQLQSLLDIAAQLQRLLKALIGQDSLVRQQVWAASLKVSREHQPLQAFLSASWAIVCICFIHTLDICKFSFFPHVTSPAVYKSFTSSAML